MQTEIVSLQISNHLFKCWPQHSIWPGICGRLPTSRCWSLLDAYGSFFKSVFELWDFHRFTRACYTSNTKPACPFSPWPQYSHQNCKKFAYTSCPVCLVRGDPKFDGDLELRKSQKLRTIYTFYTLRLIKALNIDFCAHLLETHFTHHRNNH